MSVAVNLEAMSEAMSQLLPVAVGFMLVPLGFVIAANLGKLLIDVFR